jgi:agmatine deiminase
MSVTPKQAGYRMPAEWEEHEATWLSWPKNPLTFPEDVIGKVEETYCQMISVLSEGEVVKVLVDDAAMEQRVLEMVGAAGADMRKVWPLRIRSADVWIRDYGPTFLLNEEGEKGAVKWRFNAWGGKYDELLYDDKTGDEVVRSTDAKVFRPGIVLEGGSIEVNGAGAVMTTEQCLLNENRNPGVSKKQLEEILRSHLDIEDVIWLRTGIDGDDTDGHIDDFARFCAADEVLCAHSTSSKGTNASVLSENLKLLQETILHDGKKLKVHKLPMPEPFWLEEEERYLPASYANFYIGNSCVLMPSFNDKHDEKALALLRRCFPDREVVAIEARDLVFGYGGFHCVTQQEPRGC